MSRPVKDLENLLKQIESTVSTVSKEQKNAELVELSSSIAVWECIANCRGLGDESIGTLCTVFIKLNEECTGLQSSFKVLLSGLVATSMFDSKHGRLVSFIQDMVSQNQQDALAKIREFLFMVASYLPEKSKTISSFIKPMITSTSDAMNAFLFKMLNISLSQVHSSHDEKDLNEVSLVPSSQEMLDGPLEGAFNLQPVRGEGAYSSPEEYLDTYFRLLRADCLSALNQNVQEFLSGKIDPRNTNFYSIMAMRGICLGTQDTLSIAIHFEPFFYKEGWEKSRSLMYGNLVCLSINGRFSDVLWATVINVGKFKSFEEEKTQVILQLCSEYNSKSDGEAIHDLQNLEPNSVMVASPTYYRAYEPVLRNLRRMDPENIPFQPEIVNADNSNLPPEFIDDMTTIDGGVIYTGCGRVPLSEFLESEEYEQKYKNELNSSQAPAFKSSLKKRVAIIQGPPGTGKTYLGVKVVEALHSLSTVPQLPVLLVTYKNHALDEFMKHVSHLYPDGIVRVGGRQRDSELSQYNLSNLKGQANRSDALFSRIMDLRSEIDEARDAVRQAFMNIHEHKQLSLDAFIANSSSAQLEQFLLKCPWNCANMYSILECCNSSELNVSSAYQRLDVNEVQNLLDLLDCPLQEFMRTLQTEDVMSTIQSGMNRAIGQALELWLPSKETFEHIGNILNPPRAPWATGCKSNDGKKKAENKETESTEDDPEDIEREEEERREWAGARTIQDDGVIEIQPPISQSKACIPVMFHVPKEYSSTMSHLFETNLWEMTDTERVLFIQLILHKEVSTATSKFIAELKRYKEIAQRKSEVESMKSVEILQNKKVIGMTITGASIHCNLISQLKPAIVIVEEAAEVMEPQLLSCLGPWVQQLILIGDHKQLRPRVENYILKAKYNLDISLMERLINNGIHYTTLKHQNRMRPEFAEMLKDIYPDLESNLEKVSRNEKPPTAVKSMYFWHHTSTESLPGDTTGKTFNLGRSYFNEEEAERCVRLALFFIRQGHAPTSITILGAYLGQVRLMRKKMAKEENRKHFKIDEFGDGRSVNIQTIDNYQGDENDIIIISLVRSNEKRRAGFLHDLNRRCVAQSRAKCAMYFIGNAETLGNSFHWQSVLKHMHERELGFNLQLQCPEHKIPLLFQNAAEIPLKEFCKETCNLTMKCGEHKCTEVCQPKHHHGFCKQVVQFNFSPCNHPGQRLCYEWEYGKRCEKMVDFKHDGCNHMARKKCYQDSGDIVCTKVVNFQFDCKHSGIRFCYENQDTKKCTKTVTFAFTNCKHKSIMKCGDDETSQICRKTVFLKFGCGHRGQKKCFESEKDLRCMEKCKKFYARCGHPCIGKCWEPCIEDDCQQCARIAREKELKLRQEEEKKEKARIEKEIKALKDKPIEFHVKSISPDDNTAEYVKVTNLAMRYLQPVKAWDPKITKIEQVFNTKVKTRFLQYWKKLPGSELQLMFHSADPDTVKTITTDGFSMPDTNPTPGRSLRFTIESMKPWEEMCIDNSGILLLCEVLVGKSFTAQDDTQEKMKAKKDYDSLFIPGSSKGKADEFVVFNPDQAFPRYVIYYETGSANATGVQKHTITSSRTIQSENPYEIHLRIVESQFMRLKRKYYNDSLPDIERVDYYENRMLSSKYERTKLMFERKYGKGKQQSESVLAFHGTDSTNIESIVENNFDKSKIKNFVHGYGIYLSEFPTVSSGYGNALLLCQVLPGRSYIEGSTPMKKIPAGYDSIAVKPDPDGRAEMLVIDNPDQILPCYVVHI